MDVSIILPWTAILQPSKIQIISSLAAVLISVLALVFTFFNFYWSNWRKGKIIVTDPLVYAISLGEHEARPEHIYIKVPLIFLNEGGATRFIQDLKIVLQQNGKQSDELHFTNMASSMNDDEAEHFAQQFPIEGHKAYSAVFFFFRKPGGMVPSAGNCKAKIYAKIDELGWKEIHEFDFNIDPDQKLYDFSTIYCDSRKWE